MICPVERAHEMSAFVARIAVEVPAGGRHGFLPRVRRGAGHENTGSDFASAGQKGYLVPGGRDHRHATGRCVAGTGATKNLATTGCSTAADGDTARNAWPWRPASGG